MTRQYRGLPLLATIFHTSTLWGGKRSNSQIRHEIYLIGGGDNLKKKLLIVSLLHKNKTKREMPSCIIHGVTVDLSAIQKWHPGGKYAISLAENQDVSVLFDQYHYGTRVFNDLESRRKEPTSANDDSFFCDLQEEVQKLPSVYMTSRMVCLNAAVAVAAGLSWFGWATGSTVACLLLPFLQWLLFVNVGHEAGHFALSKSPAINHAACLVSHALFVNTSQWYVQHAFSHHAHTNEVERDFDLSHFSPFVRMHSKQDWHKKLKRQLLLGTFLTWISATFAESILYPTRLLLNRKVKKSLGDPRGILRETWFSCLLQIIFSVSIVLLPFFSISASSSSSNNIITSYLKAAFFAMYPYVVGSILFMTFTQVSHVNEITQRKQAWTHWSKQMVDTSIDYSQSSFFWAYVSGGLNMQSLHHCLPHLSASRYTEFYPIFRKVCERHKIKIHETDSLFSALYLYWTHMINLTSE